MTAKQQYRPLALVLSHHADQRDHDCNLLSEEGFNVLGFADAEDTAAWLEEETPEIAIVERAADGRQDSIVEALKARGATIISTI